MMSAPSLSSGAVALIRASVSSSLADVQTMIAAHDRLYVEQADFARTIAIPTLGVGTTEFDVSEQRRRKLFESGQKAVHDFLESWDFEAYVEEFRQGREHKRRVAVLNQMGKAPV